MKKIIILIPVYNDWQSLSKLLSEINLIAKNIKDTELHCYVINDASTSSPPKLEIQKNIKTIKVFHMSKNKGHARCNAFAIRYLSNNENFDYLILMDGDGEDRPIEIEKLIEQAKSYPDYSIVAKRIKRSEGIFFKFLYECHKFITLIFAGKNINFGNYSCITIKDTKELSKKSSLWSSFSGSFKKHIKRYKEIDSIRGVRYFGPSKMSLYNLGVHSLAIIGVFRNIVFIRSLIFIFIIHFFSVYLGIFAIVFQIMIMIFCLFVFLTSLRENKIELEESEKNLLSIEKIMH
tara:strand:- start:120 stop:992 length:873 start_codon:yes stop_codon:yes gene_type:complete